ncbi:hypothetical protein MRS76_13420 [Rhizobiaceae bacterium n13]|uniref:hypothetical protein n=1 Tax=Ferirhizobium litorale TaxID=2927786 RepID=UPI0024B2CF44|nr:hypothetical protein [Fererhizobium litorale]MDI7862958.1 hypothetical protein [Fererhizobium litorale]
MGYQFIHLESYSRKTDAKGRCTGFIFGEAARRPDCSVHVPEPSAPVIVYGVGVDQVEALHDSTVAGATVEVKGGKARKIRSDQKTLHTVVASHPYTMEEVRTDATKQQEAEEWERRTIAWLQAQYGDDLRSVIRHEDESHWHIHAYVLPLSDPDMKAQKFHPGVSAKREVMAAGPTEGEDAKLLGKRADAAYKAAMRKWQDSYHEAVSNPCGHTRLGPKRRRLSRDEWRREQAQAKSLQKTVKRAMEVKADGEAFIERKKAEAARIKSAAAKEQAAAKMATSAALAEQAHAKREQERAKALLEDAQRFVGWVGRLRMLWDQINKSKLADLIRSEFRGEIDRWRAVAEVAQTKTYEAERQRYNAQLKLRQAEDAAMKARIENIQLRSLLPAERTPISDPVESPRYEPKPHWMQSERRL